MKFNNPELSEPLNLSSYINKRHPTDSLKSLSDALSAIKLQETEIMPGLNDALKTNLDLLPLLLNINKNLKSFKSKIKQNTFLEQDSKFKGFSDRKRIEKFDKELKIFEENLEMFTNESRKLLLKKKITLTKTEGKSLRKNSIKQKKGVILMTDDIILIGVETLNGKYQLESSFNYEMLKIHNKDEVLNQNLDQKYGILKIETPTAKFEIKTLKKNILKILGVCEKYSTKNKEIPTKKKREDSKILYFIKTEQFEKIKLKKRVQDSLSTVNLNETLNFEELKNVKNTLSGKNLKTLFSKIKSKKVFLLLKNFIDNEILFYEMFKKNFPDMVIAENFIEKYFVYYNKFIDEQKEFIEKDLEIVLKEKYLSYVVKKSMKSILWSGRDLVAVKDLIKTLENRLGNFVYLLEKYKKQISKFEKQRKNGAKKSINDLVKEFVI